MSANCIFTLILAVAPLSTTEKHQTENFVVHAPTQEIAELIGKAAEKQRKEIARLWLGKELPAWGKPVPIDVKITIGDPNGATTFVFHPTKNGVMEVKQQVTGPLDQILANLLPHELTHVVLAYHLGFPVPRWADEGAAILAESSLERHRQDKLTIEHIDKGKTFRLRSLFGLKD